LVLLIAVLAVDVAAVRERYCAVNEYFREYRKSVDKAAVLADLPERYSVFRP